ncbi:hypothetical protein HGM15179_002850 [Zosterops borbonicus]|uniref:Uncharacterized protein n=1 Tax=Zosterops borbonicus TaxID=364589 RepID=A0A8K1GRU6_9PASS|nr:hypothetical protein HGM15179_002850 [Zosterops borbonicus]
MFWQGLRKLLPLSVLPLSVLLLLIQPVERSSPAAGPAGSGDALPEAPEEQEQELAALRGAMLVLEALPVLCGALALLLRALGLCWLLGRWLWRRWGQEKSPSARSSARPRCRCHGCSRELLQLLRDNRALLRRCLRQSCRHGPEPGGKRRRRPSPHKSRRRLHFSPLL